MKRAPTVFLRSDTVNLILFLNLAISFYMLGLIWVIQLIHYPAFLRIDPSQFSVFHEKHSQALGILAGSAMIAELIFSLMILFNGAWILGSVFLSLTVAVWIATFFLSVPLHNRLASGYHQAVILKLIRTNWIRTGLWTMKAIVAMWSILEII